MKSYEEIEKQIRDVLEIQGRSGNWDTNEYMWGIYNGLVLAYSIVTDTEPEFREKPEFKERACCSIVEPEESDKSVNAGVVF